MAGPPVYGNIGPRTGADFSPYMDWSARQQQHAIAQAQLAQQAQQGQERAALAQAELAQRGEHQRGTLQAREREGVQQGEQFKASLGVRQAEDASRGERQQAGLEASASASSLADERRIAGEERGDLRAKASETRGVDREKAREERGLKAKKTERERIVGVADEASRLGSEATAEFDRVQAFRESDEFAHQRESQRGGGIITDEQIRDQMLEKADAIEDPETRMAARGTVMDAYEANKGERDQKEQQDFDNTFKRREQDLAHKIKNYGLERAKGGEEAEDKLNEIEYSLKKHGLALAEREEKLREKYQLTPEQAATAYREILSGEGGPVTEGLAANYPRGLADLQAIVQGYVNILKTAKDLDIAQGKDAEPETPAAAKKPEEKGSTWETVKGLTKAGYAGWLMEAID